MARDAGDRCCVPHCQPLAIFLRGKIGVDSVDPPERADPMRRPRLALAGSHAHSVQRRRDMFVRPSSRHAADHRQGFVGRPATVLATLGFADAKLRMLAASPMDRQNDIAGGLVDIGDDVDDKGAQELLA